ncbi:sucrose transport protein [Artemisia annua]|uniref:Sucrose transport protein n=1 Tax=Artemisia annua TaxID=35608 RepID=A0A2U1KI04_ARTAN|nr:sucrose transport protein [Artemisia annua]
MGCLGQGENEINGFASLFDSALQGLMSIPDLILRHDAACQLINNSCSERHNIVEDGLMRQKARLLLDEAASWSLLWYLYGKGNEEIPEDSVVFVADDHNAHLCFRLVQWLEGLASKALDLENKETENNGEDIDEDDIPEITKWEAIAWLTILTLWVSVLSGYLVDAIQVTFSPRRVSRLPTYFGLLILINLVCCKTYGFNLRMGRCIYSSTSLLFDTDWMGREVYHGDPKGNDAQVKGYDEGVREGAFGLLLNSVVLGISSFLIEPMCRWIGSKAVWAVSNFIVFACMAGTAIITVISLEESRGSDNAVGGNESIKTASLVVFAILGLPLAITYSVPFSVTADLTADTGSGQGLAIGVLNLAIVIPQMQEQATIIVLRHPVLAMAQTNADY